MYKNLPKMDKSITFYYWTVICDALRPTDLIFWKKNTNCIWFFCVWNYLKVGKFATLPLDHAGGSVPRPHIIGALHLYLGASNSLTSALHVGWGWDTSPSTRFRRLAFGVSISSFTGLRSAFTQLRCIHAINMGQCALRAEHWPSNHAYCRTVEVDR